MNFSFDVGGNDLYFLMRFTAEKSVFLRDSDKWSKKILRNPGICS